MKMSLQITRTDARIGVQSTPARIDTNTNNAQLELHHENATVEIKNDFPKVVISNRECFNTSGLKDLQSFMREAVQLGYQASSSYTAKVAGDGDSYAQVENGSNPMTSIVVRDAYPVHEFNIDFIPKARPDIRIAGGVQYTPQNALGGANNGVEGTYTPGNVRFNVTPYNVKIYLTQNPSIDIKYVGKNVDVYK
jgi:hypothetical protein